MMDKVQGPRVLLHRAVRDALDWEMAQDPRVFVMGEEVAEYQVTWGSPDTVVEKLVALRELTGPFGMLTAMAHEWDDPAFCRRSMTLLAEDVMPKFTSRTDAEIVSNAAE